MSKSVVLALAFMGCLFAAVAAAAGLPDGSTPEQKAIIAQDPALVLRHLKLVNLPKPTGHAQSLFNGKDLTGWNRWLGYEDPSRTYAPDPGKPLGLNNDPTGVFSVVELDGGPVIFATGKLFGGLLSERTFGNYHLHVEFKWGAHQWTPMPRNNGVLYHSTGAYGAWFGSWMQAVEFEIVPHSVGMLLTVGDSRASHGFDNIAWNVSASVRAGHDDTIAYPKRRYMPDGRRVRILFPAYNVDGASDEEKPPGQWNGLDLYAYGDRSIHVVNGVPVLAAQELSMTGEDGKTRPLVSGRIQLQSEGAVTYFRNITIEPIGHLPSIVTAK